MNIHDKSRYVEAHARSLADPEGFWGEAAQQIDWIEPAKKIFDPATGRYGQLVCRRGGRIPAITRSIAMSRGAAPTRSR